MNITNLFNSEDRAVSPVIGVILMVAITVILAAVIGTFVLGLGDQVGDSAPQASFSTTDVVNDSNQLDVTIEKTGGQDIDGPDVELALDGTRYGSAADPNGSSDGQAVWQTGESVTWEDMPIDEGDERVSLRLIHTPSGDTIYSTTVTVPEHTSSP